jgi:hypothetical protein
MSIQVKLVNAVLTHDCDFFTNMVNLPSIRIPIVSLLSEPNTKDLPQKNKQAKDQYGTKTLASTPKITSLKLSSWIRILLPMMLSVKEQSIFLDSEPILLSNNVALPST